MRYQKRTRITPCGGLVGRHCRIAVGVYGAIDPLRPCKTERITSMNDELVPLLLNIGRSGDGAVLALAQRFEDACRVAHNASGAG